MSLTGGGSCRKPSPVSKQSGGQSYCVAAAATVDLHHPRAVNQICMCKLAQQNPYDCQAKKSINKVILASEIFPTVKFKAAVQNEIRASRKKIICTSKHI